MRQLLASQSADACVWMAAGLLSYKLCDRDFDCEHCPLDAAMRGDPFAVAFRHESLPERDAEEGMFPEDRLYSSGHAWLKSSRGDDGRLRLGLDRFATSLIAPPRRVRFNSSIAPLARGATVCEIELDVGMLRLGSPIAARLSRRNPALQEDPGALVKSPYGMGWIVEMTPSENTDLGELLSPDAAREQARLDLRRFRRRVAHQLLAGAGPTEPAAADGGGSLADLRRILGPECYLQLVLDLVH